MLPFGSACRRLWSAEMSKQISADIRKGDVCFSSELGSREEEELLLDRLVTAARDNGRPLRA
eukprot:996053-Pyramimonas_sp.AAC.1